MSIVMFMVGYLASICIADLLLNRFVSARNLNEAMPLPVFAAVLWPLALAIAAVVQPIIACGRAGQRWRAHVEQAEEAKLIATEQAREAAEQATLLASKRSEYR